MTGALSTTQIQVSLEAIQKSIKEQITFATSQNKQTRQAVKTLNEKVHIINDTSIPNFHSTTAKISDEVSKLTKAVGETVEDTARANSTVKRIEQEMSDIKKLLLNIASLNSDQQDCDETIASKNNPDDYSSKMNGKSSFLPSPLLPQNKFTDLHQNFYTTKLVPWQVGEHALQIESDGQPNGLAIFTNITIIGLYNKEPYEYLVIKEPYGQDDQYHLIHSEIYQQVTDQKPLPSVVGYPSEQYTFRASNWKQATFLKLADSIVLQGDGITEIKTFYESIASICQSSHAMSNKDLPHFEELSVTVRI